MSTTELVLNMLAETSTKDISKAEKTETFEENVSVAKARVSQERRLKSA